MRLRVFNRTLGGAFLRALTVASAAATTLARGVLPERVRLSLRKRVERIRRH